MRTLILFTVFVTAAQACGTTAQDNTMVDQAQTEVIALERRALDRWITADPDGYLNLYAQDVTYFDPTTDKRIDGLPAMQTRIAPLRGAKLPFTEPRYEMIDPRVQRHGDVALLTYNVVNYAKVAGRAESVVSQWNATEVYNRVGGEWKIVHSHWSFVKPEIKQPAF